LKVAHDTRMDVEVALTQLESKRVKRISLGSKKVDEGLIAKGKEGVYIATLDSTVKRAVPNRVVISGAKNSLIIDRD